MKSERAIISKTAVEKMIVELRGQTFPHSAEVAKHIGVSINTLTRDLSKQKTTFLSIKNDIRFRQAMGDLSLTDKPVKDIAVEVGFKDQSTFGAQFRRKFHMSPALFRQMAQHDREKLQNNRPDLYEELVRAEQHGSNQLDPLTA